MCAAAPAAPPAAADRSRSPSSQSRRGRIPPRSAACARACHHRAHTHPTPRPPPRRCPPPPPQWDFGLIGASLLGVFLTRALAVFPLLWLANNCFRSRKHRIPWRMQVRLVGMRTRPACQQPACCLLLLLAAACCLLPAVFCLVTAALIAHAAPRLPHPLCLAALVAHRRPAALRLRCRARHSGASNPALSHSHHARPSPFALPRAQFVVWFGGLRGAISFALAITLDETRWTYAPTSARARLRAACRAARVLGAPRRALPRTACRGAGEGGTALGAAALTRTAAPCPAAAMQS